MGLIELNKGINIIEGSSNSDFEGNKDKSLVEKAEEFLGVEFPPTYRDFLLKLGCGDIDGKEFFGIIDDNFKNSSIPNSIWLTFDLRHNLNAPSTLVFVAESDEGYYALDLEQIDSNNEAPIIEWFPGREKPYRVLYQDFGVFLYNMLN